MSIIKATSPLEQQGQQFYPITTCDQIILDDGSRLNSKQILPTPSITDAGKFLQIDSNGEYTFVSISNAEEGSF